MIHVTLTLFYFCFDKVNFCMPVWGEMKGSISPLFCLMLGNLSNRILLFV